MKIRFWGVRGSTPCPGPGTVRIGGNTACIEFRYGDRDELIIIDAGSGIRLLGNQLMKNGCPKNIRIFLTHTHSDHIMGLPYFTPIYIKGINIDIYGPVTYEEEGLEKIISDQFSYRYFPVKHSELSATIKYHHLQQGVIDLGDGLILKTHYLNHPILTLGYRFEYEGKSFTTAYDTEPFFNLFPEDPEDPSYDEMAAEEGRLAADEANQELCDFYAGSDVLVHDSQYTQDELIKNFKGWGHSSFEWTIKNAGDNDVKKLFLFHHAMERDDENLEGLLDLYRKKYQNYSMEIDLAREGNVIEL